MAVGEDWCRKSLYVIKWNVLRIHFYYQLSGKGDQAPLFPLVLELKTFVCLNLPACPLINLNRIGNRNAWLHLSGFEQTSMDFSQILYAIYIIYSYFIIDNYGSEQ
jgi:hypothetical protein